MTSTEPTALQIVPRGGGGLSAVALELPDDLSQDEWLEVGKQLSRVDRSYRWWVGDWLAYGEFHWGESYEQAVDQTGLDYQSLRICKYVSTKVEVFRRRNTLSWSHHAEVADLPPDEQTSLLDRCEAEGLSRNKLRAIIAGPRRLTDGHTSDDEMPGLLRFMQANIPTHIIVQLMLQVFFSDANSLLDVTYGDGNFWGGVRPRIPLTAHDADPSRAPDGVMDFTSLSYDDSSHDVVLFDPPHLADGGDESVMTGRFGTVANQKTLDNLITNGVRECWRVCSIGMIVKVTDHIHGQAFQDETLLVLEALPPSVYPYDKVHQVRDHAFVDPSWGDPLSARNNGSTYLIFRKGSQLHVPRHPKGATNGTAL